MVRTKKYEIFETLVRGTFDGNPFLNNVYAVFSSDKLSVRVDGFYDGEGIWRIRFLPQKAGIWSYTVYTDAAGYGEESGCFECIEEADGKGIVKVRNQFHFCYEDGTPYYPFGTTCYAWIYQTLPLQEQTLSTLAESGFNKLRMCVFPKWFEHSFDKKPLMFPFEGTQEEGFDYMRPNLSFFRLLDQRIAQLGEMGIQADLILFHPYEKKSWAFNWMTEEQDFFYLKYMAARYSAFPNVWWSMANEWDLFSMRQGCPKASPEYWSRMGRFLKEKDPYGHLNSIHNCMRLFDYGQDWISHVSLQKTDTYKTAEMVGQWRKDYAKPVVLDECSYEGNVGHTWGNITGEEMTRRFCEGIVRGGYVSHGETYTCPEDLLWWSHGGTLKGSSPQRIAFLRQLIEEYPQYEIEMISDFGDVLCGGTPKEYLLYYYSFFTPCEGNFKLPVSRNYTLEVIDTWNMTREKQEGVYTGNVTVALPSRPYMLVRFVAVSHRKWEEIKLTPESTFDDLLEMPGKDIIMEELRSRMGSQIEAALPMILQQSLGGFTSMIGMEASLLEELLDRVNNVAG